MIIPGSTPTNPLSVIDLDGIYSNSQVAHGDVVDMFVKGNRLYNIASITEDIVSSKYLSIRNIAKSVVSGNVTRKNYVIESFSSEDYADQEFPVDKHLNMDTQNGELTLPVLATENLDISAIIVESDSNGTAGNSFDRYKNNDINAILSPDSSSMFEYEKVTNMFTATELYLSITLKLEREDIANAVYLKMFADIDTAYPDISVVDISRDGETWETVAANISLNKNDYFIRFTPKKIRYIKFRLHQNTYRFLTTQYGAKYRYAIGIREISVKKITYDNTGEYISIPFAAKNSISSIALNASDKSLGDIKYFISANNGGRWMNIEKDVAIALQNSLLGLRGDTDIESIRLKIMMDRLTSPNVSTTEETTLYSQDGRYFLRNRPLSLKAFLGGHISCGDEVPHMVMLDSVSSIPREAVVNKRVSIVLGYVPYSDDLYEDIVVKVNGLEIDKSKGIIALVRHPNPMNSVVVVDLEGYDIYGMLTISLKQEAFTGTDTLKLKRPLLSKSKSGMSITVDGSALSSSMYSIIDRQTVRLSLAAFNSTAEYKVSYMPAVEITDSVIYSQVSNEVEAQQILKATDTSKITFEYSYKNLTIDNELKYYTPTCYEYRLELL